MSFTRRQILAAAASLAVLVPGQAPRADDFIELRARNAELGLLEGGAGKTGAWILGKGPAPAVIRAMGGSTPKASAVSMMMFRGCPITPGIFAFAMKATG